MATHYSPKIVTDGIVLMLDAGNPKSYSGTGTTWYDLSNYGHHATAVGSPTFVNKGPASYWNLNGSTHYFSSAGSDNYVDLCALIYLSDSQPTLPMLFSQAGVDKSLRFDTGGLRSVPDNNDWNFGQTADVFINGQFNQSGVSVYNRWVFLRSYRSNNTFTNPFAYQISGVYTGNTRYYAGYINYICAYNRQLSNTEVTKNYNAMKGRFGL